MTTLQGNLLTERVIGFAIDVHRQLGRGLLESAYEECLCFELKQSGLDFARQVALPVIYKEIRLDCGYRMDVVVQRGHKVGLLMNFNSLVLKDGLRRFML